MTDRQKAEFIKVCLLYMYRIRMGCKYVCTEFGLGNADVFAEYQSKKGVVKKQYEIEIKVSKSDIKKEFACFSYDPSQLRFKGISRQKYYKHVKRSRAYRNMYFYMCVPEDLYDFVEEQYTKYEIENYGILTCRMPYHEKPSDLSNLNIGFHYRISDRRNAVKQAEYKDLTDDIIKRMSSEIFCVHQKYLNQLLKGVACQ